MVRSRLPTASLLVILWSPGLVAQDAAPEARIWLDRGDEPVVQRGDRVRIYYRSSVDAYVAIFQIDTDGSVSLLHPRSPDEDHRVRAGRDYRLLFPRTPYWLVDEDRGIGYYFLIASPEPFDFTAFEYAPYDRGWELTNVGRTVYDDPYLAIDDFVASLIPSWDVTPYALDFITYHVGQTHTYPRFLCYDCHGFRTYAAWNPYTYACTSFRLLIWDDPYYYPAYRYSGTRVVFVSPLRNRPRFQVVARGVGEPWAPIVRAREAPAARTVEYKEPGVAPRNPTGGRSALQTSRAIGTRSLGRAQLGSAPRNVPAAPARRSTVARPRVAPPGLPSPTAGRSASPSGAVGLPGRPNRAARPNGSARPNPAAGSRPVLQRRPASPSTGSRNARPRTPVGTAPARRPTVVRTAPSAGAVTTRPASPPMRVIFPNPRRSTGASTARATPARPPSPTVRPRPPSSGGRPTARPSGGTRSRGPPARPPRRRPGGG